MGGNLMGNAPTGGMSTPYQDPLADMTGGDVGKDKPL